MAQRQPPLFIRAWRHYRALSQADLASQAGLSREGIQRLEGSNRPARPSTIRKLATALGIEPHQLYGPPPDLAVAADREPELEPGEDDNGR